MQYHKLAEAVHGEVIRVANATRSDVSHVTQLLIQDEAGFNLRTGQSYRGQASEHERLLRKLEWLKTYEQLSLARSAPGLHMETEWGGDAPT